jgi:hypothetical protein
MFEKFKGKYHNALVIGTGGGNDIVSAIIPAMYLKKQGIHADIAGILSPAAIHMFDNDLEKVVNKITSNVERIIPSRNPFNISFIDNMLPDLLAKYVDTKDMGVYDLSIRYGTDTLVKGVNEFIDINKYDLVIGVDVGGDILARGSIDNMLLSPIMDFTTLHLLGKVKTDSILVEFGIGTDGELRPDGMDAIINEFYSKNLLLEKSTLSLDNSVIKKFVSIFDDIKQVREGRTAVMTLQTLEALKNGSKEDIVSKYRFKSQINFAKTYTKFDVVLPNKYFGELFVIDAKKFVEQRKETAFSYNNPLEQYIKLKTMQPNWKTELDGYYLCGKDNWTGYSQKFLFMYLLVPSMQIAHDDRVMLINEGISNLNRKYGSDCSLALILTKDLYHISIGRANVIDAGLFSLLTPYEGLLPCSDNIAKKINLYQKV